MVAFFIAKLLFFFFCIVFIAESSYVSDSLTGGDLMTF